MNKDQQIKFFEEYSKKQSETILKKGNDYSNEDRLSNFKQVAQIIGIDPRQVCLCLIGVKIARLTQLFSGKTPNNESIDDSILDGANYFILLAMLQSEVEPNLPF